eukprot:scaffold129847_cov66-Phaeocystis_antarctica.AAC.5
MKVYTRTPRKAVHMGCAWGAHGVHMGCTDGAHGVRMPVASRRRSAGRGVSCRTGPRGTARSGSTRRCCKAAGLRSSYGPSARAPQGWLGSRRCRRTSTVTRCAPSRSDPPPASSVRGCSTCKGGVARVWQYKGL